MKVESHLSGCPALDDDEYSECRGCVPEPRRWIPVTDRLPERYTDVLVVCAGTIEVAQYVGLDPDNHWRWEDIESRDIPVTHWMPLPDPPKESV